MADDLEARLESHAQAFEGLLSLIPANEYYSKDNSDQWQRKKQTKEQKRQAKRAKFDPANQKSAKDVMDENERKRKRELGIDDDDNQESSAQLDLPADKVQPTKKQKVDEDDDDVSDDAADDASSSKKAQADKRKEKRRLKKEKADKQKAKLEAKKAARKQEPQSAAGAEESADEDMQDADDVSADEAADDAMDFSGLVDNDETSTPASPSQPEVFDNSTNQSATSSSSSIVPASNSTEGDASATKPKKALALKLPEVNAEELQARLKARIEALRAQRKADGPSGGPRNRQELLESRRKKEEARKQHKKELRLKAKEEEERLNDERLRGSGSPLATPDIFSPRPIDENNFSFGRVAFDDEETDPTLGSISAHKKKKGPSDIKTALAAAERKAQRLAGMDEDKRKEIEEKDMWLNAKKRAHGERVKDDQSLLKKTLKRKTDQKTKSATQWNERIDNVRKGKEMKDKKRTENLAKRAAEKGAKKGGKKGGSGGAKKKARPGFEGKGFKA
ncbi:SURF6-domain-containing protein, partial [Aureobasidium melanogenum]